MAKYYFVNISNDDNFSKTSEVNENIFGCIHGILLEFEKNKK